jgi:hypothetical protein
LVNPPAIKKVVYLRKNSTRGKKKSAKKKKMVLREKLFALDLQNHFSHDNKKRRKETDRKDLEYKKSFIKRIYINGTLP